MSIELKLIGFGDDKPAYFQRKNNLSIELTTPTTIRTILNTIGIDDPDGLVLMTQDDVIPVSRWDELIIEDNMSIVLLSAFEGG